MKVRMDLVRHQQAFKDGVMAGCLPQLSVTLKRVACDLRVGVKALAHWRGCAAAGSPGSWGGPVRNRSSVDPISPEPDSAIGVTAAHQRTRATTA